MGRQSVRVRIKPDMKEVWVVTGTTVSEALFAASVPISMPCGGAGRCGKCIVLVDGDVSPPDDEEKKYLPSRLKGARLACRTRIRGNVEITIPETSRVRIEKVLTRGCVSGRYRFNPGIVKVYISQTQSNHLKVLKEGCGISVDDLELAMTDPDLVEESLRKSPRWRLGIRSDVTVVASRNEILRFEEGDTTQSFFGVAFDIGTNTIVGSLVNLDDGSEIAVASSVNPQVSHGDDVISRIRFCKSSGGLELLRREILSTLNGLIEELTRSVSRGSDCIYLCSAVGNTVMQYILLGISPVDLGRAPYRAKPLSSVEASAIRYGIRANPVCRLYVPPPIGGFVGGDMVSLMIANRLHRRRKPVLAIDLGTNGEIAVAYDGRVFACSTAAGPAFEGERISCGMRATSGAIERVGIGKQGIRLKIVGDTKPVGLCGSGLISLVTELLDAGVLESSGRLKASSEIAKPWLARRVIEGDFGREFVIHRSRGITLRQGDIREIQLGKAAISAGIRVLCSVAGLKPSGIKEAFVAGGFGSSLLGRDLKRIGILPADFSGRVRIVGNGAIEGAKILLTSEKARHEANEVASLTQHVRLFTQEEFKEEFYGSMHFPPQTA